MCGRDAFAAQSPELPRGISLKYLTQCCNHILHCEKNTSLSAKHSQLNWDKQTIVYHSDIYIQYFKIIFVFHGSPSPFITLSVQRVNSITGLVVRYMFFTHCVSLLNTFYSVFRKICLIWFCSLISSHLLDSEHIDCSEVWPGLSWVRLIFSKCL